MTTPRTISRGRSLLTAFLAGRGRRAELAERLGCSRALVTMWLNGKRTPGGWNALRLEEETKGAVPASLWGPRPRKGSRPVPRRAREAARQVSNRS